MNRLFAYLTPIMLGFLYRWPGRLGGRVASDRLVGHFVHDLLRSGLLLHSRHRQNFMKTISVCTLTLMVLIAPSSVSHAALITASPGGTVVDFSQFGPGFTSGGAATEVGGLVGESVTWSSTHSRALIGSASYGIRENGVWDSGRNGFVGLDTALDSGFYMRFDFNDGPVSVVGGFVNYCISGDGHSTCAPRQEYIIDVLGVGDVVLESYTITTDAPISTPGVLNGGAFRGISRPTNDIIAFRTFNAINVLDDLEFARGVSAVPEPFADFTIEKAKVKFHRSTGTRDRVKVEGELTLGEDSNGIDPVNEVVVVTVGILSITIDDGFVAVGSGFAFEGTINGAEVKMTIRNPHWDVFKFKVKAKGLSITDISNPVEITLQVGDDRGTASVRLEGELEFEDDGDDDKDKDKDDD